MKGETLTNMRLKIIGEYKRQNFLKIPVFKIDANFLSTPELIGNAAVLKSWKVCNNKTQA